jgi:hypothetical protein
LQGVARLLADQPTDHAVMAAISAVLGRMPVSVFMCDSATKRGAKAMKQRYIDDDDSPFDRNGVLKDGHTATVSMMMRDSQRVIDASLHRPGFRLGDADMRDAKQKARDAYERDLVNAWRDGGSEGAEGSICTVQNDTYPERFGSPGHIKNGICTPDDELQSDARRKAMTTDEIARDHQRNMSNIYQAYDTSLCDAWRRKP